MSEGRFDEAAVALQSFDGRRPCPPPAALWKLGRRCAKAGLLKQARHALKTFLKLYPRHEDADAVRANLVQVLQALGKNREADALA